MQNFSFSIKKNRYLLININFVHLKIVSIRYTLVPLPFPISEAIFCMAFMLFSDYVFISPMLAKCPPLFFKSLVIRRNCGGPCLVNRDRHHNDVVLAKNSWTSSVNCEHLSYCGVIDMSQLLCFIELNISIDMSIDLFYHKWGYFFYFLGCFTQAV